MLGVDLPVAGQSIDLVALLVLGLASGFVAGFYGVGGGIITVPMLYIVFRVDSNVAVGSSLAVILGTSISATIRHHRLRQVDARLGLLMFAGGFVGTWLGAGLVELLKRLGEFSFAPRAILAVNFVIPLIYGVYLVLVGRTFQRETARRRQELRDNPDAPFRAPLRRVLERLAWRPLVSLPSSGIERVSVWMLALIGVLAGLTAGLLGVGGGIVMVPAMIYILGVPTGIAIGTSLFMIILNSAVGTFFHASGLGFFSRTGNSNCDLVLATCLLIGSTLGAQLGAAITKKLHGVQIRRTFAYLAYATAIVTALRLADNLGLFGGK
ncbi:MAG: sulfite exporter TauE/SafE family protein [Verrucomicrobia bacterium]|nr:sulfite exporter TauE/SafE family protein [Verrucomicrobiota bacterium]